MSQLFKYREEEIKELIHQYKQHDCLWNINSPSYKNKILKQRAWFEIANYFEKSVDEVKRKIQYLRAAYVNEKNKVNSSWKSDSETPHEPSLFYYDDLDFLDSMVIWRNSENKFATDLGFESVGSQQDGLEEEFIAFENREEDYLKEPELNCKVETYDESESNISFPSLKPTAITTSSHFQHKRPLPEKKNANTNVKPNKTAPLTLQSNKPDAKYLYNSFGKTIALQLQELPLEDALLAMSEIQNIITKKTLEHIRSLQKSNDSLSEYEDTCHELIEETFNDSS